MVPSVCQPPRASPRSTSASTGLPPAEAAVACALEARLEQATDPRASADAEAFVVSGPRVPAPSPYTRGPPHADQHPTDRRAPHATRAAVRRDTAPAGLAPDRAGGRRRARHDARAPRARLRGRRTRPRRDRRPVLCGGGRDAPRDGGARARARRRGAARRRVQAAHLALRVPRSRRGRAAPARRGARAHRPARRHRGDGHAAGRARGAPIWST